MAAHSGALRGGIVDGLRALADGRWSAWNGLIPAPNLGEVQQALGAALDSTPNSAMLGGSPTLYHRYPPSPGAPHGITVWFENEAAVVVEIRDAVTGDGDRLGKPDATLESSFGASWQQEVHASRGLVLHRNGAEIALIYGIAPFEVEGWMADPLRHSGPATRHRRR